MDLDTPIADIFNLEMPVDDHDDEEIPSTQPDLDDGDDREEESEPPKASEPGWGNIISETISWQPLTSKRALG